MSGRLRRSRRAVLEKPWQSLEERGSAQPQPALTRSQTYDPSSCTETEAAVGPQQSPSSLSKSRAGFQKAFEQIAGREELLGCFSCAWQREVPYHGRLYVSSGHLCFHSSLLLKDIKAVIPVSSICALKKTNTALLVPNALSIRTAEGEKVSAGLFVFLFMSPRRRKAVFQLLRSLCRCLRPAAALLGQDSGWSPPGFPVGGGTEQALKKSLSSSQSDLEQSMLEPDSLLEPQDERSLTLIRSKEDEEEEMAEEAPAAGRGEPRAALQACPLVQLCTFNTVLLLYLLLMVALLLTSGYIGLRILELEQQLAVAGAWPNLSL